MNNLEIDSDELNGVRDTDVRNLRVYLRIATVGYYVVIARPWSPSRGYQVVSGAAARKL
jgi:hypothetical protein